MALTGNKLIPHPQNKNIIIPNLDAATVNCVNISDTVIYWTNDTSIDSLLKLLNVCYNFNWRFNLFNYPSRGCVVKGTLSHAQGTVNKQTYYAIQCPYGKSLVLGHDRAESGKNGKNDPLRTVESDPLKTV